MPAPDPELRQDFGEPEPAEAAPPSPAPGRRWRSLPLLGLVSAALFFAGWQWTEGREQTRREGFRQLEARQFAAAVADLESIIRWRPDDLEAVLACAKAHYQLSNYGRAEELLDPLLRRQAGGPEALLYRGLIDLARRRPQDAITRLEAAARLDAGRAEILFYLGFAHYQSQQYGEARFAFERFLASGSHQQELVARSQAFVDKLEGHGVMATVRSLPVLGASSGAR